MSFKEVFEKNAYDEAEVNLMSQGHKVKRSDASKLRSAERALVKNQKKKIDHDTLIGAAGGLGAGVAWGKSVKGAAMGTVAGGY